MKNPNAVGDLATIDRIIAEIRASFDKPNSKPQTSMQMRDRADRLRSMATAVRITGGRVNPAYEYDRD